MGTDGQNLPPLPWTESDRVGMSFLTDILDADGNRVVTVWGANPERRRVVADLIIGASRDVASNRRIGGGGLWP